MSEDNNADKFIKVRSLNMSSLLCWDCWWGTAYCLSAAGCFGYCYSFLEPLSTKLFSRNYSYYATFTFQQSIQLKHMGMFCERVFDLFTSGQQRSLVRLLDSRIVRHDLAVAESCNDEYKNMIILVGPKICFLAFSLHCHCQGIYVSSKTWSPAGVPGSHFHSWERTNSWEVHTVCALEQFLWEV